MRALVLVAAFLVALAAQPAHAAIPDVSAAAAGATWCEVDFDAEREAIVLVYSGAAPRFTTIADETGFKLQATFADGAERRFQFGEDLPRRASFARWNLKRAAGQVTLSVALERPLGLMVAEDAETRRVVLSVVGRRVPAVPRPVVYGPVPLVSDRPLAPPALLVAPVRQVAKPLISLAPSVGYAQYQEDYRAGDVQVQSSLLTPGLALGFQLPAEQGPAWRGSLGFGTSTLAFRDLAFPLSVHTRQTYAAETLVGPGYQWGALSLEGGLGYWARLEQTVHSAVSPAPTYAFANERWLHGPQFGVTVGWTLLGDGSPVGGWRLVAEGVGQPLVFSRLEAGLPALPTLFGGRVALGLEGRLGGHQVTLAFQRRMIASTGGYAEVVQGPSLSFR